MAQKFSSDFNYETLASIYPMKKSEIRRQPLNDKKFSTAGSDLIVVLNKAQNSFIIPSTLCLSFEVDFTTVDDTANNSAIMLGCAASFFRQLVTVANISGTNLETIGNYNELYNALMNQQVTAQEKGGMWSLGFEGKYALTNFSGVLVQGINPVSKKRTFVMPILSILTNTDKLIPCFLSDLELRLTLENVANIFTSVAGATGVSGYEISNVNVIYEQVTLEASSMATLLQQFPQAMTLKSSTYLFGSTSLPQNATGITDLTYSHSVSSLKEFIWTASADNAVDKGFSGINPNLTQYELIINNTQWPIQGVRCSSLAETHAQLRKAWSALFSTSNCGSIVRDNMGKSINAGVPSAEYAVYRQAIPDYDPDATLSQATYSNKFWCVLDLEIINNSMKDVLINGISTKDSVNTLRLHIANNLARAVAIKYWSHYDAIISFNYQDQIVSVNQ